MSVSRVSLVVLTFNEERNLAACLDSAAGLTPHVFVVDSGSSDDTTRIAQAMGARVVTHAFETHATQWDWALSNLPFETEWVLALDADQRLTPELRDEIAGRLSRLDAGSPVDGFFLNRRQVFRGRWIRHGGYYPKYLLKLFRRGKVSLDHDDLVDHHFLVSGQTEKCKADLVEDNLNESAIAEWTAKHNRYAVLQARHELDERSRTREPLRSLWGAPDARVRWFKQQWARLPLYLRPCAYVFYRYVIRLGFLDGKQGFVFHVLQGFWYRLLVDVNIDELRHRPEAAAATGDDGIRETPRKTTRVRSA